MNPVPCLALAAVLVAESVGAQELPQQSPRVSSYTMKVTLDAVEKSLSGEQEITWRNATSKSTDELQFHLYLNAFRGPDSTLMVESDAEFRAKWRKDEGLDEYGSIDLDEISLVTDEGTEILESQYIAPDDGNENDRTVLRVALPSAVEPGQTIRLRTRFTAKLPKAYRRTGWAPGDAFYCMHWYPKLGVLEEEGWNCHQFHSNTEFFADFSTYDVEITVPASYALGATGKKAGAPALVGEQETHVFHQDDVHDFAFVASARHKIHRAEFGAVSASDDPVAVAVAERMGKEITSFDLPKVDMFLMLLPEHDTQSQRARHFEAMRAGIRFYGLRYGKYPYETITAVDPSHDLSQNAGLAGGMEYPTLFTCGTTLFPPMNRLRPEGVTIHEFGHQFWYGLSGNNEFEESWLDEGLNTYTESRVQVLDFFEYRNLAQTTDYEIVPVTGSRLPITDAGVPWRELYELLPPEVQTMFRDADTLVPDLPLAHLIADQPWATLAREASYNDTLNDRLRFVAVDNPDPMVALGWEYLTPDSYRDNSYRRPAILLNVLERLVGRDRWWHFLRVFHAQARFQHPTTEGFIQLLGEMCGDEATSFFRSAIAANSVMDYGIERVVQKKGDGPSEVVVRRYGTLRANVVVRFRFEGREEDVVREIPADEAGPWTKFVFGEDADGEAYGEIVEVWVDPPPDDETVELDAGNAGIYLNDIDLTNNAWRRDANHRPAIYRGLRHTLQVQGRLSHILFIG